MKTKIIKLLEQPRAILGGKRSANNYHKFLTATAFIQGNLKTFIDIGVFRGDFIDACLKFQPQANIFGIEPLGEDLIRFKYNSRVNIIKKALWNKAERCVMWVNKDSTSQSTFFKDGIQSYYQMSMTRVRFDSLNIKIQRPSFVKLDVERSEINVLEGFGNLLDKVDVLQLEVFGTDLIRILQILKPFGFEDFIQIGVRYDPDYPLKSDLIFFRRRSE